MLQLLDARTSNGQGSSHREGNFPHLVGIPHVAGLIFLRRGVKLVQKASGWSRIPSIAGGWMVINYSLHRRGRTGKGN